MHKLESITSRSIFAPVILSLLVVFMAAEARGQWTTSGTNTTTSNNVGILTTTPAGILDVGDVNIRLRVTTTDATDSYNLGMGTDNGRKLIFSSETGAARQVLIFGDTTAANMFGIGTSADSGASWKSRFVINQTGKVGIGTSGPQDPLHVYDTTNSVGTIRLQGGNNAAGFLGFWDVSPMLLLSNNRHPGYNTNFNTASPGSMILVGAPSGPADIGFYTTSTGVTPTYTELVKMKADGKVGIGITSPNYRLDVQGGSINSSGGLCIAGDCKTAWSQVGGSQWTTSGTTINYSTGNVGIGVASPTTKLDVSGTVNATALTVSGTPVVSSQWTTSGTTVNYANGNVGIATAAPTEKLHVTGNVKVTGNIDLGGNINAKYQDVAEWVESSQELSAGTVVILDSSRSNQVIASTSAYDSRVAGVISRQPGIALGEHGEGRVLVATTGRVKVKVDARNGPIRIGDLLVTSDIEGFAMKSTPVAVGGIQIHRPGTLIGKALEPLAQGTGEILVLLSLQ